MAKTNFGKLTDEQKTVWSREIWKTARQNSFAMNLSGSGMNSAVQRITELTETEKGKSAVLTLVPDLEGDGVVGDFELWDNEEEAKAKDQKIFIDQLRNANRLKGRMANQESVVNFRETSRDLLSYWMADRIDQTFFLTASGWDPRMKTNGAIRTGFSHDGTTWSRTAAAGHALVDLEFFSDPDGSDADRVKAPSANRYFRWDGTSGDLKSGDDNTNVVAADTPSYAMLVELKAFAKDRRLRTIRGGQGTELYHVFMHPKALGKLKLDSDFLANLRNAGQRGSSNPLFSGAIVTVDGIVIHENTHVINTLGATAGTSTNVGDPGYKWGPNADVDGCRILMMGAQAIGLVDLGAPSFEEDSWDYENQNAIAIGKIFGLLKPQWFSPMDNSDIATEKEDFGIVAVDVAI